MKRIDITLPITREMTTDARTNEPKALNGHVGTHFDVMDKEFPLAYTERAGIVFDARGVGERDIEIGDIDLGLVGREMFVAFCTGFIEAEPYGTARYFKEHPQLSVALLEALMDREVSIIGIDFAGVRRGAEHTPMDQRCADRGVFVVENLCGLGALLAAGPEFLACTYPLRLVGMTGTPCRVIAKVGAGE